MKIIPRYHLNKLKEYVKPGKVIVLYGPRRTGKTTLIQQFIKGYKGKCFLGSGDDLDLREILESERQSRIVSSFKGYDLVVIDEAQRVHNIGFALKILVDSLPEIRIIASGSSSFELSQKIGAPLTGRHHTLTLYPFAQLELEQEFGRFKLIQDREDALIYGTYPEAFTTEGNNGKERYLLTLRDSYLYRDILEIEHIRNASKLQNLVKLLSFQIGKEVSLNELAQKLGIAKQTVNRYLDLLEKSFIIKKVTGFSRNLRKEITSTHRFYFFDNGVRNAVISNFAPLSQRNDIGDLWENFLFMERLKKNDCSDYFPNYYFWRTYDKNEIDLIEEKDNHLYGFEFKWNPKKKKIPALFQQTYENASVSIINSENWLEFVL